MTRATLIAVGLAVCAVSSGAQVQQPTPAPVPLPPTQPATPSTPAPQARPPLPPEMPYLLDIPGIPEMPAMPDMPEMPDMPDMPDMPEMPDMSDFALRFDALHDMQMDLQLPPMPDMDLVSPLGWIDADMDRLRIDELSSSLDDVIWNQPFDFDFATPAIPPMPPMAPLAPMDIEPMMAPIALQSWSSTPRPGARIAGAPPAASRAAAALDRIQGQSPFERQFGGLASDPRKAWAPTDPADSLYRLARETLNRGEYSRAAKLFSEISQRYPNSVYAGDARYWRAFALYRIGGPNDLREALRTLESAGPGYRQASLQADATELAARIRGALAVQGDPNAAAQVRSAASQGDQCDREDLAVRIEALKSLGKTDPELTTPILRRVLARRDDCSASLRRAALYLLGKRNDTEAMNLVMVAARNDSDLRVRSEALRFLAAMPGDQAISTIEEIARTPGNEPLQRAAIAALGRSDSPRARQSLRAIIERTDLSESLRATALSSLDDCECGRSTDNGAYLRSLYPRLETSRLKSYALRTIAKSGGPENEQWLLTVVRNQNEPVEVRAMALRYAGASSIPIADLVRMYDAAGDRPLRVQLIQLYSQRTDPAATDKLLEIAKRGTDPDMRRMAISALSRKNDPRTKQLLLEIIAQ